jgi:hypothetical protein
MPRFFAGILDRASRKDTAPVNRYEGFQQNGSVVLREPSQYGVVTNPERFGFSVGKAGFGRRHRIHPPLMVMQVRLSRRSDMPGDASPTSEARMTQTGHLRGQVASGIPESWCLETLISEAIR